MDLSLHVGDGVVSFPGVLLLGTLVGLIAGMFGVGGGFLLTPLLVVIFRVPLPVAVGSGLCQMVGTALAALLRHRKQHLGEVRIDLLMLPGAVLGTDAGARLLALSQRAGSVMIRHHAVPISTLVIEGGYIVLLLGVAVLFVVQGRGGSEPLQYVRQGPFARLRLGPMVDLPAVPPLQVSAMLVAQVGFLMGMLGGLLGLGGGIILMPMLVYGFGLPMRQAAGTGILMLFVSAISGTIVHALRGNVHLGLAMTLLMGSSISAQFGARLTSRLPTTTLRQTFAIVIVIAAIAVCWDLVRRMW